MDWLKDPKNQPKAAIALSVLIVLIGVVSWYLYMKPSSGQPAPPPPQETAEPAPPGGPAPGEAPPPSAPAEPAPAAGPTPGTQDQVTQAVPMETWRSDPFLPLGYKPPVKKTERITPPILDFPFPRLPHAIIVRPGRENVPKPELPQPPRRMAGILVNGKVYAIIETNGKAEIVQAGDVLEDRLAAVERIERDKVVLKTTKDEKPRYIVVRMAASPRQTTVSPETPVSPTGFEPMRGPGPAGYPTGIRRTREGDLDMD